MRTITEQKIKAFQQGTMEVVTKKLSKRELEDHKRKEEELAAQEVYKDFVASFEDSQQSNKMFVKGMEILPGPTVSSDNAPPDKGRSYKTGSKLQELASTFTSFKSPRDSIHDTNICNDRNDCAPSLIVTPSTKSAQNKPQKQVEKRKTNLEAFKDELKRIQEERDRRHELKMKFQDLEEAGRKTRFEPYIPTDQPIDSELSLDKAAQDICAHDDIESTNLFISNLSRTLYEGEIMELFGRFGPLASVKIMYPRSEEERARGSNCGFVAFMTRADANEALEKLDGHDLGGLSLRISWGKPIHIPPQAIYTKPSAASVVDLHSSGGGLKTTGYPFNATAPPGFPELDKLTEKLSGKKIDKLIGGTVVKVTVPTDKQLLCLIHRTIEFVIREGPKFERALIEKEKTNSLYRFLSENDLASHVYYRWKLYSILQGDSVYQWSESHFKMFEPGSIWIPPAVATGKHNMVSSYDESFERAKAESEDQNYSQAQWKSHKFSDMIQHISPDRDLIADAMVYAIERAHMADDIAKSICSAMSSDVTPPSQKVALLFLISDILHNCSSGLSNCSIYRKVFEEMLPPAFESLYDCVYSLGSRVKTEQFKSKVMACFRAWEDWAVYPSDVLIRLQNIFLGLQPSIKVDAALQHDHVHNVKEDSDEDKGDFKSSLSSDVDIDGTPMDDHVNFPLTGTHNTDFDHSEKCVDDQDPDIDGDPLDINDADLEPIISSLADRGFFMNSKWESVNVEVNSDAVVNNELLTSDVKKRSRLIANIESKRNSVSQKSRMPHKSCKKYKRKPSTSRSSSGSGQESKSD